ncbi:MAG: glycosyltransferase family 4 protein [Planctomycetota bacterium]
MSALKPSSTGRKRLCFVVEATEGGVRKHVRDLLRVFLRPEEGFEIFGIFGDRGEVGFREELTALAAGHSNFSYEFVPGFQRAIRPWTDLNALSQVKRLMAAFKPDIVHSHSAKAGFIGRTAARTLGVRTILHTPHVFPFQWTSGVRGRLFLALERHAAGGAGTIICVSESQRDDALQRGLCDASKLIVIRNAIEAQAMIPDARTLARTKLDLPQDARVVGMVARLAPQKGVGVFARAAAEALRARPDAIFALVGGGPLEDELRERLSALNVPPEHFRILGHRSDAEALYPAFDMLVLSSLYEGLPYVLLEAMARGVPVVATDVLGSRDVVADGVTGLLARVNDPADIAAKIVSLLDDPEKLKRFGEASKRRVADAFSFDEFVRKHRDVYLQ